MTKHINIEDKNMTEGGPSLDGVWKSDLNPLQKLVMYFLGSRLDSINDFEKKISIKHKEIADNTGLSRRTVIRIINDLEKNGYLKCHRVLGDQNYYRLTPKIFS